MTPAIGNQKLCFIVIWALAFPLSTLCVIIRFIVRSYQPSIFNKASHVFLLLGWFFATVFFIEATASVIISNPDKLTGQQAEGIQHIDLVQDVLDLKLSLWSVHMLWCSVYSVKGAVLAIYSPLIPRQPGSIHRMAFNAICVICPVCFICTFFFNLLGCWPISKEWDLSDLQTGGVHCFPAAVPWVFATDAAFHMGTDALLFALPIPLVLRLWRAGNVPLRSILGLFGMFSVVLLCILTTCLRIYYSLLTEDGAIKTIYWCAAELTISIFVACLPAFRAAIKNGTARGIVGRIKGVPRPENDILEASQARRIQRQRPASESVSELKEGAAFTLTTFGEVRSTNSVKHSMESSDISRPRSNEALHGLSPQPKRISFRVGLGSEVLREGRHIRDEESQIEVEALGMVRPAQAAIYEV